MLQSLEQPTCRNPQQSAHDALGLATELANDEGHPDVLVFLERVRQRQKAGTGHGVTGVAIGAGGGKAHKTAHDGEQHHGQNANHAQPSQSGGCGIQVIEQLSHTVTSRGWGNKREKKPRWRTQAAAGMQG